MPGTFIKEIISKFLKYHENVQVSSPLTIAAYKLDLKQTFVDNKNKQITSYSEIWTATRPVLNQWGKLSPASRNRKIATLKSFFNWLYQERLIDKNYAEQLICPKVPKKIPHFLSVDEVIAVLNFLANEKNVFKKNDLQKIKTLFLLLYGGGLRISEACGLKWLQIQWNEKRILVRGKGNKERLCVVPNMTIQALKVLQSQNEKSEYVFGEKPLNARIGYQMIHDLGKKTGLTNALHPHALRHSFATHLLASGANLRTLQTLLGHESLQATEKYTHLSVDQLARLVDQTHPLSKLKLA